MHPVEALLMPLGWVLSNRRADEAKSISHAPELRTDRRIDLASPSFDNGHEIPARHCGRFIGDDISPGLSWDVLSSDTTCLVLVLEDVDSPGSVPGIHTVAAFAPNDVGLPEGALSPDNPDIQFLPDRSGRARYAGPRPLPGHGTHHYRFHLYALDTIVDLATVADADRLPAALAGHVLASGTLTGIRRS